MTTTKTDVSHIKIIDTDSHVVEPADLWTSRLPKKWHDQAPQIAVRPGGRTGRRRWRVGERWLHLEGLYGWAGFDKWAPEMPETFADIDPACYDPIHRLARLDEYGIHAQVLYPNIIGFETKAFIDLGPELSIACTQAYNDFLVEFASVDPNRLVPIAMVPFWDIDAAVKEIQRCAEMGHRGLLFANKYERIGLPYFYEPYWDRIYDVAQSLDLSINFHVGFLNTVEHGSKEQRETFDPRWTARRNTMDMMHSNGDSIADILTSGVCDRFPRLKWVSVESGMGYLPYLLESLDWHWRGHGAHRKYPMLPSEYFQRQCYGTFWFETKTLSMLELYPDNFMFETDFPHPTSLSPGPVSQAELPSVHVQRHFSKLPESVAQKVLHDNAAALYRL